MQAAKWPVTAAEQHHHKPTGSGQTHKEIQQRMYAVTRNVNKKIKRRDATIQDRKRKNNEQVKLIKISMKEWNQRWQSLKLNRIELIIGLHIGSPKG